MKITINSKKMKQAIDFSRPGSGYIHVDMSGDGSNPGSLGMQICDGGKLIGNTISYYGDNEETFGRLCRNWFRAYLPRTALERWLTRHRLASTVLRQ
jgi:hypothetical protein